MIENLTPENFWNELKVTCPESVARFCSWIDEYKQRPDVDWPSLFISNSIKFHSLPLGMQMGILTQFKAEMYSEIRKQPIPEGRLHVSAAGTISLDFNKLENAMRSAGQPTSKTCQAPLPDNSSCTGGKVE